MDPVDLELAEATFRQTAHKLGLTDEQLAQAEEDYDRNYPPTPSEPEKAYVVKPGRARSASPTQAVKHLVKVFPHVGPDRTALCGSRPRYGWTLDPDIPSERECKACFAHPEAVDVTG